MQEFEFVENFANQFDDTDPAEITMQTVYKDLEEWSSLMSLSIIAMCDEEYSVKLTGNDMKNTETVEDLFELINSRK